MAGPQPRTSFRSLFQQLEILPVSCKYILPLMIFIIKTQEIFQKIHLYTILIQGIQIFTDQMPTCLVFKTVHSMLA
jgi:hypothetical protein